jgi:hypothetical protein
VQEDEKFGQDWAQTLETVQVAFATAGVAFLRMLVAAAVALFGDVTDDELADAVAVAWRLKKERQLSEMLFLTTVPAVLTTFRARGRPPSPRVKQTVSQPLPLEQPAMAIFQREPEDSDSMWAAIRRVLKQKIPAQEYANWFMSPAFQRFGDGALRVSVPDAVTSEFLELEYGDLIRQATAELFPEVRRILFVLEVPDAPA